MVVLPGTSLCLDQCSVYIGNCTIQIWCQLSISFLAVLYSKARPRLYSTSALRQSLSLCSSQTWNMLPYSILCENSCCSFSPSITSNLKRSGQQRYRCNILCV